jgi:predicted cupin superfamily sugar epimerase
MTRADELIRTLGLVPHPERGHYVETYRAEVIVSAASHTGARAASTAIYFLLTAKDRATFLHRLRSDEIFHLYEGGPLAVLLLHPSGESEERRLGLALERGERPQLCIPAGTWFGTELSPEASHCLWGCTVAPGFEFVDFELAQGNELAERYPEHDAAIARMTRAK